VRAPVEQRDFIGVGDRHVAFASLALERVNGYEPSSFLDFRMATVLAFKGKLDGP